MLLFQFYTYIIVTRSAQCDYHAVAAAAAAVLNIVIVEHAVVS